MTDLHYAWDRHELTSGKIHAVMCKCLETNGVINLDYVQITKQ